MARHLVLESFPPEFVEKALNTTEGKELLLPVIRIIFNHQSFLYYKSESCDELGGDIFRWSIRGYGSVFNASFEGFDSEMFSTYEAAREWVENSIELTVDEWLDIQKEEGHDEDCDRFPLDVLVDRRPLPDGTIQVVVDKSEEGVFIQNLLKILDENCALQFQKLEEWDNVVEAYRQQNYHDTSLSFPPFPKWFKELSKEKQLAILKMCPFGVCLPEDLFFYKACCW